MADIAALKSRVDAAVASDTDHLIGISRQIHGRPELAFEERHAHDLLTGALEDAGFQVERSAFGLDTAFAARVGSGDGPLVAILCEYDALPGIGHACGHNVIAAAGLGAGLAAARFAEELGGSLVVLGTPAEEGGGGKVMMAERGAFEGVDAALMIHPAGLDLARFGAIAIQQVAVTYRGHAAHAAAAPHLGRNALDAAVLGYVNVAALRQHILPTERIHGIFTDGGRAPNVVPESASTFWYVRSPTVAGLAALKERVMAALEAGATATGCTVEHEWQHPAYADMVDNDVLVDLYRQNVERTGRTLVEPDDQIKVVGSTDMGNVSHLVPSIHPTIAVSPPNVPIHTTDFERFAGGSEGDRAVIDGARTLAGMVVDLWVDRSLLTAVKEDFAAARAAGRASGRASVLTGS
ncbi:MAG: M20 family metallopeptidase [Acidimicrobiales bacterium]|nr:M20 family metallopeptidase [Acidimicrobiales bacterium]